MLPGRQDGRHHPAPQVPVAPTLADVDRRTFTTTVVGALLQAAAVDGLSGCSSQRPGAASTGGSSSGTTTGTAPGPVATAGSPSVGPVTSGTVTSGTVTSEAVSPSVGATFTAPPVTARAPVPHGTLWQLPGGGNRIALTVDDGVDPDVVAAYARLSARTGLRLTFFCTGSYPSWTEHADLLRPLVDSGQVFLANHTWTHPDLTRLTDREIAGEVRRAESFLHNSFGVTGRPFLRPPFGYHDARVRGVLADLGYPAVTMWWGSLADSIEQRPARILTLAREWFRAGRIVIGHANHSPVIQVMDDLVALISQRGLQPVHLGDVFRTG